MGVYESLTREELVRKLLTQENLCHELKGKVGKLQEEIFRQEWAQHKPRSYRLA